MIILSLNTLVTRYHTLCRYFNIIKHSNHSVAYPVQIFLEPSQSHITLQRIFNIANIKTELMKNTNYYVTSFHLCSSSGSHLPYSVVTPLFHLDLTLFLSQHEETPCTHSFIHSIVVAGFLISVWFSLTSQARLLKETQFHRYHTTRTNMQTHCIGL